MKACSKHIALTHGVYCRGGVWQLAPRTSATRRWLNVHEYRAMDLMRKYGIPVPRGAVASTPEEAEDVYRHKLGGGGASRGDRL